MSTADDPGLRLRLVTPPKSCECHSNIYGPFENYPYAAGEGRSLNPDASVADYRVVLDILLEMFRENPEIRQAILADNPARLYDCPG